MRFSCDSCGAQYMISDEKVGPGGVKVRCKRCSHVVLVKPAPAAPPVVEPAPEPPAAPPAPGEGAARSGEAGLDAELGQAFDNAFGGGSLGAETSPPADAPQEPPEPPPEPEPPAAPAEVEWYVAIADAQVGPLLPSGVKSKWEAGEVGPDTLVWRSGMADWTALSGVPELAQLLAPVPRPQQRPAGRVAEPAPAHEPARAPEPASASDPGWKPAAATALAALASQELAAAASKPPEPERPAPGSIVDRLNLPEGGVEPTGMVPLSIRSVEATGETLLAPKARREEPRESTEVRQLRKSSGRWRAALLAVLGLLVGGGAAAWWTGIVPGFGRTVPQPAVTAAPAPAAIPAPAATPTAPPTAAATPAAGAAAAPVAQAEPTPAPRPEPTPAPRVDPTPAPRPKAAAAAPARAKPEPKGKRKPERKVATAERAAAPEPTAAPRKPAGDPLLDLGGGGDDELSKELSGAGKKHVYVPPAPGSDLPDRVTDPQIIEAVLGKKPALAGCVEQQRAADPGTRGTLLLRWGIAPDGSVREVRSLSSEYAKQPIVPCISAVVKSIRFPRSRLGREVESFPFKF